jgi:hypothetical protein
VTVTAGGALGVAGKGVAVVSTSGGPSVQTATGISTSTFTGAATQTFAGALTVAVAGIYSVVTVGLTKIFSVFGVEIGFPIGPKYFLATEEFLTQLYINHTHISTIAGFPTSPPTTLYIPQVLIPGVHSTLGTRAN